MSKYIYTDDMRELSGFGGGYEETCRKMVVAGLEWLDANPTAEPQFSGYKGVYGLVHEDNEDAKNLYKAVVDSVDDCTGAMIHCTLGHILHIHKTSWEEYCVEMRQMKTEEVDGKN